MKVKMFLCRNDVRIFIVTTSIGGGLQIWARSYLRRHPELLNKSKEITDSKIPRGGDPLVGGWILGQSLLAFLAEHGLTAGVISGITLVLGKIPVTALSKYVKKSSPYYYLDSEMKRFIIIENDEIKINIDTCGNDFAYLWTMLSLENLKYERREDITKVTLENVDYKLSPKLRHTIACLINLMFLLKDSSSLAIIIESLIKAIKEGRLSKNIARYILRLLLRRGVPVDRRLIEAAAEAIAAADS